MTDADPADWGPALDDLRARRAEAAFPRTSRHTPDHGDARDRVRWLLDPDSFVELGRLAGPEEVPADAFVAGHGTVDGRPVLVGAEEFSVAGGSIGIANASKRSRIAELAEREGLPLVLMLEGAGHRATNALAHPRPAPGDLQALARLGGRVPLVVLVTGPSAGHGALAAPLADLVVMVEGRAALFAAGPPVVRASLGEQVTKEDLGGAQVHSVHSGVAHAVVPDARRAVALGRRYLSYLPSNADGVAPWAGPEQGNADVDRRPVPEILDIVPANPRRPYRMMDVLEVVFDHGSVMDVQSAYGPSLLTALARLGGHAVAVVANDPGVEAGAITAAAAEKAARFIRTADAFNLPLVFLADTPGMLAGRESERAGVLRLGAQMFTAQHRSTVPKLHVTLRKAFGFGSSVMAMNPYDHQAVSLAFPTATLGGIPADVGARTAGASDETRRALVDDESAGPWGRVRTGTYDDAIDPREVRDHLRDGLRLTHQRLDRPRRADHRDPNHGAH